MTEQAGAQADQLPRLGDVFAFPVERIGRFGALQVIAVDAEKREVTVAVLNWVGEQPPELADLASVPRWVHDFMYWPSEENIQNTALPVPSTFIHVGNLAVTGSTECRSFGGWEFAKFVVRQQHWDALPKPLTAAFKASLDSAETVCIPGLIDQKGGGLCEFVLGSGMTRHFYDDATRYHVADDFRLVSLRAWPALGQVRLHAWRDDLLPFLETSVFVYELHLSGHGQRELDFSRTHLLRLSVDATGLQRLVLPPSLDMLTLHGSFDGELVVEAAETGRWMALQVGPQVAPIRGLEQVHGLRVSHIERLSLRDVVERHPQLRYLHLFGAPGVLEDLAALPELKQLESLWFVDLFGYGPDDFPDPAVLLALQSLDVSSIPADVAAHLRKACKKHPRIELSVRKPRKPEWLQENLGNPLRHWDGREGIPAATAKKASAAYRGAVKAVREADGDTSISAAITEFLRVIQVLNAKKHFLYTIEREEVVDAVNTLTQRLSPEAQRALDPIIEESLDD